MKIAIIGYGKMGKAVEQAALERGHEISLKADENNIGQIGKKDLEQVDLAVEFTRPETAFTNILKCFEADIPVVCGTTGWTEKLPELKKMCREENKTLFFAPNFSIGMNIFMKINKLAAKFMNHHESFVPEISETHHIHKKDAPSGTAVKLAEDMINEIEYLKTWKLNKSDKRNQLKVNAEREGEIFGIHHIAYESETDKIELSHRLKSRESLAHGTITAAEFCLKNSGFLTMDNLLKL